jgi:hypothetical protein
VLISASLLLWLNRTLIDQTSYLAAVTPIIRQPAVQQAITVSATNTIFDNVNVSQIVSQFLPPRAQFLSGPITTQVKNYTGQTIAGIIASPKFENFWIVANTHAHTVFLKVAQNSNASPTIDLNSLYQYLSADLKTTPLAPLLGHQLPANIGNITIATVPALAKIPHYTQELSTWRWVFIGLVILLSALAVWLARLKRRALLGVGFVWALSALLTLAIVRITRNAMLADISNPLYKNAASAIWTTVLHSLFIELEVIFTLGLATIIVSWLLGPSRLSYWLRSRSQALLATTRLKWFPTLDGAQPVHFLQSHRRIGEWTILGISLLALIAMVPLTVNTIMVVAVAAIVVLLIFEFLTTTAPASNLPAGTTNTPVASPAKPTSGNL